MADTTPGCNWTRLRGAGISKNALDVLHPGDEVIVINDSDGTTGTARVLRVDADRIVFGPVTSEAGGS